jgi:hypothetical protein
VNPRSAFVNSHSLCAIPEQSFEPVEPTQPPLSRWIAHVDTIDIPFARAKAKTGE